MSQNSNRPIGSSFYIVIEIGIVLYSFRNIYSTRYTIRTETYKKETLFPANEC